MKNFDSRTYSVNDFREWDSRGELLLQPKFQRRSVWSDKARSYLIDSIVRGKPIPKIFIRQDINPRTKKTVREVVDGQQRLRTILSFLKDGFKLSKTHSSELGGLFYSEMPDDTQTAILKYELSVDLLLDAPDKEVLDIFARLNSYAVKLNSQELRNASYFGEFKTLAYGLGFEYVTFWTENKIFSDSQLLRMSEVELVSDLMVVLIDGTKGRKSIDAYYKKYDDEFKEKKRIGQEFRGVMDAIGEMSSGAIGSSPFKSPVLFYSLFSAIHHHLYGQKDLSVVRKPFKVAQYPRVWNALEGIDAIIKNEDPTPSELTFIDSLKRHTTDEPVRLARTKFLIKLIAQKL
ncbi:MAG: hypothetical protein RLZZ214_2655 [Verrucomicrobiota bacterium]|jgi:hypothetical protein